MPALTLPQAGSYKQNKLRERVSEMQKFMVLMQRQRAKTDGHVLVSFSRFVFRHSSAPHFEFNVVRKPHSHYARIAHTHTYVP